MGELDVTALQTGLGVNAALNKPAPTLFTAGTSLVRFVSNTRKNFSLHGGLPGG